MISPFVYVGKIVEFNMRCSQMAQRSPGEGKAKSGASAGWRVA